MFKNKRTILLIFLASLVGLLLAPLVFYVSTLFFFRNKIIPRVIVAGEEVSGFKKYQLEQVLSKKFALPEKLTIKANSEEFEIPLSELNFSYNFNEVFESSYALNRNENYYSNAFKVLGSFLKPAEVSPTFYYNKDVLQQYISVISSKVSVDPIYPILKLNGDFPEITKGAIGRELDKEKLFLDIENSFRTNNFQKIATVINKIDPTLDSIEEQKLINRAQKLLNKTIEVKSENFSKVLGTTDIFTFVSVNEQTHNEQLEKFIDNIEKEVEREPQNSVFTFRDGKVTEFTPSKDGLSLKKEEFTKNMFEAIKTLEGDTTNVTIDIPLNRVNPEITNNEVNDLGINELIGTGVSFFKGSIPGRVHNVGLASSRINGFLLKPGEIFSFNNAVGDVSVLTGYKQAYIIQDGKTILGDGGGVCQVSTTLFRAVLSAGLPITDRSPHSYRVSYYEQSSSVGLDATVYSPTTDFKFKNDTPANILVQTIFEPKINKLTVELYGTSDGRSAQTTKPTITSSIPPPDDLYIDDPTLPAGTIKQIDYKAWGAKVVFDYTVTRAGEIIYQKRFISNYKPWQAKFLRGTTPN